MRSSRVASDQHRPHGCPLQRPAHSAVSAACGGRDSRRVQLLKCQSASHPPVHVPCAAGGTAQKVSLDSAQSVSVAAASGAGDLVPGAKMVKGLRRSGKGLPTTLRAVMPV